MIEHFYALKQYIEMLYTDTLVEIQEVPSGIIYLNILETDQGVELMYKPEHGFGLDIVDRYTNPFIGYTHVYCSFEDAKAQTLKLVREILNGDHST